MLTEEETLIATLATQIHIHRRYPMYVDDAVKKAKEIIEKSKKTEPKAGLTPIKRKKLVRKVREF